jgi:hypothetical protein
MAEQHFANGDFKIMPEMVTRYFDMWKPKPYKDTVADPKDLQGLEVVMESSKEPEAEAAQTQSQAMSQNDFMSFMNSMWRTCMQPSDSLQTLPQNSFIPPWFTSMPLNSNGPYYWYDPNSLKRKPTEHAEYSQINEYETKKLKLSEDAVQPNPKQEDKVEEGAEKLERKGEGGPKDPNSPW